MDRALGEELCISLEEQEYSDGTNPSLGSNSIASTEEASWHSAEEEEKEEAAAPLPIKFLTKKMKAMIPLGGRMADPKKESPDQNKLPSNSGTDFDFFKTLMFMKREEPLDLTTGGFAKATIEANPIKAKEPPGAGPYLPALVHELPKAEKSDFVKNWMQKLEAATSSSSAQSSSSSSSIVVLRGSGSDLEDAPLGTSPPASAAVSPSGLSPSTEAMLANDISVITLDNSSRASKNSSTKSPEPGSSCKPAAELTLTQLHKRLKVDSLSVKEIVEIEDEIGKLEAIRDVEIVIREEKKVAEWKKKRMEKAVQKGANVQAQGDWRKRLRKRGADEMC